MTKIDAGQPLVSVDELAVHVDDPTWITVDCRFDLMRPDAGRQAYEAGHIPRAYYADLDKDLASVASAERGGRHPLPDAESLGRLFTSWGVGVDSMVVVYSGGYSDGWVIREWPCWTAICGPGKPQNTS